MKPRAKDDTTPLWYFLEPGDYLINVQTNQGAEITGVKKTLVDGGPMTMFCINGKWYDRSTLAEEGWRMTNVTMPDIGDPAVGW